LLTLPQEGVVLPSDQELLAEYLNAIRLLTAAVHDDRKGRQDLVQLSDRVLEAQKVGGGRSAGHERGGRAWGAASVVGRG
jgi:hypothetical protein